MSPDVILDRLLQFAHGAEGPSPDALAGDLRKPTLDLVEPGRTGRGEMHVVARAFGEPLLHVRMLVSTVVVENQVDAQIDRSSNVNLIEEA